MYGLDINFLKDREPRVFEQQPQQQSPGPQGDRRPLIFGLVGMLIPMVLMGGYWLFSRQQVAQLEQRSAQLDGELAELESRLQEVSGIQAQIDVVRAENASFVSIFDEIVPWSALLQEIRSLTPTRVQITDLEQTGGETSELTPEDTPPIAGGIRIVGVACSFNDINDFLLVLRRSPLLDGNSAIIESSERQGVPLDPDEDGTCPGDPPGASTALVDYTILANITKTPSSELIDELDRQGTVGLVTRLRALRETGVLADLATAEESEATDDTGEPEQ